MKGIGVLGCGQVWTSMHLPALQQMQGEARVVAVFDPDAERAAAAARATGVEVAKDGYAVIDHPEVEVVAVLTPAFTHADYVEACCRASRHLMLEKPVAHTLVDSRRIVRAVRRAGVRCMVPFARGVVRDLFDKLIELTRPDGELGEARLLFYHQLTGLFPWMLDEKNWVYQRAFTGAPFVENGVHHIHLARELFRREPTSAYYQGGRYFRNIDGDDLGTLLLEFGSNHYAQFTQTLCVRNEWNMQVGGNYVVAERGLVTYGYLAMKWNTANGEFTYRSKYADIGTARADSYRSLFDAIETGSPVTPNEVDAYRVSETYMAALGNPGQKVSLPLKDWDIDTLS